MEGMDTYCRSESRTFHVTTTSRPAGTSHIIFLVPGKSGADLDEEANERAAVGQARGISVEDFGLSDHAAEVFRVRLGLELGLQAVAHRVIPVVSHRKLSLATGRRTANFKVPLA